MKNLKWFVMFLLLAGCTTGQCRRDGSPVIEKKEEAKTLSEKAAENSIVLVAKSDNSLQCGYNQGVNLEDMANELEGIQILKAEKRSDGLMRIQSCGKATGMLNVYHIYRKDVKKALKLGYKVLDTVE